jgi:hypothetical protein
LKEAKIWAGKELYDYIVANPIPATEVVLPQDFYDNLPGNSGGFEDDMGSWHEEWTKWAGVNVSDTGSGKRELNNEGKGTGATYGGGGLGSSGLPTKTTNQTDTKTGEFNSSEGETQ